MSGYYLENGEYQSYNNDDDDFGIDNYHNEFENSIESIFLAELNILYLQKKYKCTPSDINKLKNKIEDLYCFIQEVYYMYNYHVSGEKLDTREAYMNILRKNAPDTYNKRKLLWEMRSVLIGSSAFSSFRRLTTRLEEEYDIVAPEEIHPHETFVDFHEFKKLFELNSSIIIDNESILLKCWGYATIDKNAIYEYNDKVYDYFENKKQDTLVYTGLELQSKSSVNDIILDDFYKESLNINSPFLQAFEVVDSYILSDYDILDLDFRSGVKNIILLLAQAYLYVYKIFLSKELYENKEIIKVIINDKHKFCEVSNERFYFKIKLLINGEKESYFRIMFKDNFDNTNILSFDVDKYLSPFSNEKDRANKILKNGLKKREKFRYDDLRLRGEALIEKYTFKFKQ